jgi:signal transduction histidine kinase
MARTTLEIRTKVAPKLPNLSSDRQKVKQILVNLLSNALKFTHEGSVTIEARYVRRERVFALAVADTGIGIAPVDQERIFEDFRQVDSTPTRAYGGTGLGLSICRRLAAMLRGSIKVESELGRGSTFVLLVPARLRK